MNDTAPSPPLCLVHVRAVILCRDPEPLALLLKGDDGWVVPSADLPAAAGGAQAAVTLACFFTDRGMDDDAPVSVRLCAASTDPLCELGGRRVVTLVYAVELPGPAGLSFPDARWVPTAALAEHPECEAMVLAALARPGGD